MNPTLEQVKEWIEELLVSDDMVIYEDQDCRIYWNDRKTGLMELFLFECPGDIKLRYIRERTVTQHGILRTFETISVSNKQDFKTLLELSGVIDKG